MCNSWSCKWLLSLWSVCVSLISVTSGLMCVIFYVDACLCIVFCSVHMLFLPCESLFFWCFCFLSIKPLLPSSFSLPSTTLFPYLYSNYSAYLCTKLKETAYDLTSCTFRQTILSNKQTNRISDKLYNTAILTPTTAPDHKTQNIPEHQKSYEQESQP